MISGSSGQVSSGTLIVLNAVLLGLETWPTAMASGGRVHRGHPIEAATDVSMMTRVGVERIMRFAFRLAESRPRRLLTVMTKSNAQRHAMVMWDEIATEIAREFPDVTWDKELVDAATARMVNRPASLDTLVATNLHADILSDLAAALAGSLGIAPTGNIDPERRYPSMFAPIHGSAFDIMGQGLANPVGTFWSAVMLLEHLGEAKAAKRLMQAVETVTANPAFTRAISVARRPPPKSPRPCAITSLSALSAKPPDSRCCRPLVWHLACWSSIWCNLGKAFPDSPASASGSL